MDLVSLLGPVPLARGEAWAAVRFRPDDRVECEMAETPEAAIRRIARTAAAGVIIDEAHRALAGRMGLGTAALSAEQRRLLATLALGLSNGGFLDKITDPVLVGELVDAVREFEQAEAWRRFDSDFGLPAVAAGALGREREVQVLGSAGEQVGLVIHSARGVAERMRASDEDELRRISLGMDGIILYLDDEPAWARDLLAAAFELRHAVLLRKMERGRHVAVRADEVRLVVAALRAAVAVAATGGAATGACEYRGKRVEVRLEPGEALLPGTSAPSPTHDLDRAVCAKLLAFAKTLPGFSEEWLVEGDLRLAPTLAQHLSLFTRRLGGRTIADQALEAGILDDTEAGWVAAQQAAPLTLLEVEATSVAGEVAVVDGLTGERMVVRDVGIAGSVGYRDTLLARPVRFGHERLVVGSLERALPPAVARAAREAFFAREGQISAKGLADPDRALRLLALALRPPAREDDAGGIRTTDGDPLVEVKDRYEVDGSGEVGAIVGGLPDVFREAGGRFTWTRKGNAMHASWRRTVLGEIEVEERRITVTTNSLPRADEARALLGAAFGDRLRFAGRQERRMELPPGLPAEGVALDAQPIAPGPWLRLLPELERLARLRETLGARPRPAQIEEVHAELCEVEWQAGRGGDPLEEQDPDRPPLDLRRLLGISSRGTFIGPDDAFGQLGAGVPLTLALTALAASVGGELDLPVREQLGVVVELWNRTRGRGRIDEAEALDAALGRRRGDPALRDAAAWVLAQARRLFAHDRRRVEDWKLVGEQVQARWWIEPVRLGLPAGTQLPQRPLVTYDPNEPPDPRAWALVPQPWREELVAAALRELEWPFGEDLQAFVRRWVEIEDALAERKPNKLVTTVRWLEKVYLGRGRAIDALALALVMRPEVSIGTRASRALGRLLDDVVEIVGRPAAG